MPDRSTERTVLVDGYNVIHRTPRLQRLLSRSLETARNALLAAASAWLGAHHDVNRMTVAFDGPAVTPAGPAPSLPRLKVIYSRRGQKADDCLLALLREAPAPGCVTVVSDDTDITRPARQLGAAVLGVREFLPAEHVAPPLLSDDGKPGLSPQAQGEINAELRRRWGLE